MSMNTFKILFYLRKNYLNKEGKAGIMIRITINGEMVQFSSKLSIEPSLWDTHGGKAKGKTAISIQLNSVLDDLKTSIINHYREIERNDSYVTVEKLRNAFMGIEEHQNSLLEYYDKHNEGVRKLIGIESSSLTYKRYCLSRKRLSDFIFHQHTLSDIPLKNLNLNFIREYEIYLKADCKLSNNVAAKMIQHLKKIVTLAFNDGIVRSNHFVNYHIKMKKADVGYLTKEELELLLTKQIEIQRLDHVRDIFIFCCFTGLSYIDVRNLTYENICKSFDGKLWIMTKRQKTDNPVNVLLLDIPKQIIDKYRDTLPGNVVLPVLSNQRMNSYLKELADICKINKNLTFHMSRHTFATTITLSNGVPIETVSKMLGHSNLKTTQIYARITNEKISHDMLALASKLQSIKEIVQPQGTNN